MTITKGFLTKKYELRANNLIGGLFLWILSGYILYAFLQLYREAFRIFTSQLGDQTLLVLTPGENYIYNVFFASIASALGYSFALKFILQTSLYGHNRRTKSLIRRTLNNEGFFTWLFLSWFGKLGSMIGICYLAFYMQYDLDLIKEFSIVLILLPLVLFYSSWPDVSRLFRTKKVRWFMALSGIFLVMSFGFAFKNFLDYKKINKNLLSRSIEHVFELKVPKSQSQQRIFRRSTVINIYILRDTMITEEPAIFFDSIDNRIDFQEIQKMVALEKDRISIWESNELIANLHIDERISMRHIKSILDELRKADLRKVQYSTGRKYSRYPAQHPAFKYSGIPKILLPRYFPEFAHFLDSAEQIDLKGKAIKLPESAMFRNGTLKNYNRIEITITPDSVILNHQKIDSHDLEQVVYAFIKKYSPNYMIILNSDDEITYGRYIEYLDLLSTQIDRLRNELSLDLHNQPFDSGYRKAEQDTIKRRFPINILEWSTEERRLQKLVKKANDKQ